MADTAAYYKISGATMTEIANKARAVAGLDSGLTPAGIIEALDSAEVGGGGGGYRLPDGDITINTFQTTFVRIAGSLPDIYAITNAPVTVTGELIESEESEE